MQPVGHGGNDLARDPRVQYQTGMIQRRGDVKVLRRGSDPLDDFPAGVRGREEQVPPARDAQIGSASPRHGPKVVEAVPGEPASFDVPGHPLREHQGALVVTAETQGPGGEAAEGQGERAEPQSAEVAHGTHVCGSGGAECDERVHRRRLAGARQRREAHDAPGGMTDHAEGTRPDMRAEPLEDGRGVTVDQVFEPPGLGGRFPGGNAVPAEVGEPDVEPPGRQPLGETAQPDGVTGKGAVEEQDHRRGGGGYRLQMMQTHPDAIGGADQLGDHPYRPACAYAWSSTSTGWRTGRGRGPAASPAPICMMQPGFPVTTRSGSALVIAAAFPASTDCESPGSTTV